MYCVTKCKEVNDLEQQNAELVEALFNSVTLTDEVINTNGFERQSHYNSVIIRQDRIQQALAKHGVTG